ncbi:MAG: hypothetical protein IPM97_13185 [Bdellovibrionaceae bacterium]|nr:hypothetical protein [Pseudobdellovibrionaceae bacterium]
MKCLLLSLITFCVVIFVGTSESFAQEEAAPAPAPSASAARPKAKSTRTQKLNFEDELVEGSTQKPELFYLFQKKNFNYKRLIKLRENFKPEMRKTSEDIQRIRGGT